MRRELLIALGVLVPFAALVAAGFYFQPTPPPPAQFPLPHRGEGQGEGKPALSPRPDAAVLSVPAADAGPHENFPPELRAPLTAVLPEVRRCFADQHLKAPHAVKVRFTPTRGGGFSGVSVDEQNPYLAACLEDVFTEVSWTPQGPETFAPATHSFSFDPSPE